jgi:hypothetical protein
MILPFIKKLRTYLDYTNLHIITFYVCIVIERYIEPWYVVFKLAYPGMGSCVEIIEPWMYLVSYPHIDTGSRPGAALKSIFR